MTWDGKELKKEYESTDSNGRIIYSPSKVLSLEHDVHFPRFVGNSIIELLCPEENEDENQHEGSTTSGRRTNSSSSSNSSSLDFAEIFMIFRNVATPKKTREALRLMLVFNTRTFENISK